MTKTENIQINRCSVAFRKGLWVVSYVLRLVVDVSDEAWLECVCLPDKEGDGRPKRWVHDTRYSVDEAGYNAAIAWLQDHIQAERLAVLPNEVIEPFDAQSWEQRVAAEWRRVRDLPMMLSMPRARTALREAYMRTGVRDAGVSAQLGGCTKAGAFSF